MTHTTEITVNTSLNWTLGNNRFSKYYETTFNGKVVRLIKGFGNQEWFAKDSNQELLPFDREANVNDLVLKVESFLMN